jgi:hypothetical protein
MRCDMLKPGLATQITWATTFTPDALRLTRRARDTCDFKLPRKLLVNHFGFHFRNSTTFCAGSETVGGLLNYCTYAQYTTSPERVQNFGFGGVFDPNEVGHERFLSFVEDAKSFFANQRAGESIFIKPA